MNRLRYIVCLSTYFATAYVRQGIRGSFIRAVAGMTTVLFSHNNDAGALSTLRIYRVQLQALFLLPSDLGDSI